MEHYVVTGATGHLGNTLVRKLCKLPDCTIKLLVLTGEDVSLFEDLDVVIRFGNVLNKAFLEREINAGDIVFHLAGIIDITSAKKDLLYKVNVEGTKNIASVCLKKKVKRFIYTSSVHAIEPLKNNALLLEPMTFEEDHIVGDYAKSKTMATKAVFRMIKKGLNGIVTYPSGIIGPNDNKLSEMGSLIIEIANKKISNRVRGGYNFVDVRDVADGLIAASQIGRVGEGYILSGYMTSVDELFTHINHKFNRTKLVPRIAMWFVKLFSSLAERYFKARKMKPLFTKYSLYTLTTNHNFSCEKAKKELHYNPRPVKDSLSDAVDWLIEHKKSVFNAVAIRDYEAAKGKQ